MEKQKISQHVREEFEKCETLDEVIEVFQKNYDCKSRKLSYLEKHGMIDQLQQAIDFLNIKPKK